MVKADGRVRYNINITLHDIFVEVYNFQSMVIVKMCQNAMQPGNSARCNTNTTFEMQL